MYSWDFMIEIYIWLTVAFFGITGILAQREINTRQDFKMVFFGGTLNIYRYYRYLRNKHETPSARFKLFLLAHLNFALCVIVLVVVVAEKASSR
jgi:hypothetical protein